VVQRENPPGCVLTQQYIFFKLFKRYKIFLRDLLRVHLEGPLVVRSRRDWNGPMDGSYVALEIRGHNLLKIQLKFYFEIINRLINIFIKKEQRK